MADRVSGLPEGVLHHVLSLLPAHDAVRTSVLARRWRYLWAESPGLRVAGVEGGWGPVDSAHKFRPFAIFVDVLLDVRLCVAAPLDSCDFDFDVDLPPELLPCIGRMLNNWIRRALALRLRVLRLRLWDPLLLPDAPLVSHHLTRIELRRTDSNRGFFRLSNCPALVDLKMEHCRVGDDEIWSASLKHLTMAYCEFRPNIRIELYLPSLVSMELNCLSGRTPFLATGMPSLVTASVTIDAECDDRCLRGSAGDCGDDSCLGCRGYYGRLGNRATCVFLGGLSQATHLELSAHHKVIVFKKDLKRCPTFTKLKTLLLKEWCVATDLDTLICFLQHTPILEKLTLQLSVAPKYSTETDRSYNPTKQSFASNHLKVVQIICEEVDWSVHKILKTLSTYGIPLGHINIKQTNGSSGPGSFNFVCTGFSNN